MGGPGRILVPEIDVWRAANLLIRRHGANAELEAAKRADLMLDRGDDERRHLWARIRRAIEEDLPAEPLTVQVEPLRSGVAIRTCGSGAPDVDLRNQALRRRA
jgi:hypothetical protein